MQIHFTCTMCGNCCHNLRLPLSVEEAMQWLDRGGDVHMFSEAIPWTVEPAVDDRQAQYKRARSFPGVSGELPVRVIVTIVASFDGPCPYLQADLRCGAYDARPNVCRIYPAEINPFVEMTPDLKSCPPDAWSAEKPALVKQGQIVDSVTAALIADSRAAAIRNVAVKERLCANLDISIASLANEGFVSLALPRGEFLRELRRAYHAKPQPVPTRSWLIVSNRNGTIDTLRSINANAEVHTETSHAVDYIAFFGTGQ
ncbi:YkgJ family cysteine cluster protein [Paraburkholderia caribensis]|uniref:YkgJ family cysteine cluster protein n=1 Tax=Paraburkholderia caribensis TaxID=75105 RepID=UPI001CC6715A|nr:YkgJ family cysteine cluster protein [Paraburkholderia caribensis]